MSFAYDCPVKHGPLTHKFTGKERDSESNLDNFGARYGFVVHGPPHSSFVQAYRRTL
jgi:hypothetical protein